MDMVDKISGDKVGVVLMCAGPKVPDLGQVEMRISHVATEEHEKGTDAVLEDVLVDEALDMNDNKSVASRSETVKNLVTRHASSFVNKLDEKFQWPGLKKSAIKWKVVNLVLKETGRQDLRLLL